MNGILILDKPQGFTSFDAVAVLRGLAREKKIGHTGTLDPMATGVLPVLLGRAAKALNFLPDTDKEYTAAFRLGERRDTGDITGQVVEERPVEADRADLEGALAAFRGEITQIPPMYSALKRDGKKLYELARAGKEVERAPRPVTIHALEVVEQTGPNCYTLRVRCSKGTYVRTLCHDIGAALGCGGCMSALRRTEAAGFSLAEAVPLEALLDAPDPAALLRPVDAYFFRYPAVTVEGTALRKAKNGNPFPCSAADGDWRVYGPGGEFLLLGRCAGGMMSTIKSFFEV